MTLKKKKRPLPKGGWECTDVIDLIVTEGYPNECEKCGRKDLRFLHRMAHSDCPRTRLVGCKCALRLTSGCYDPKPIEKELRNRWNKRQRFPGLKRWKVSAKGNEYIRTSGCTITIFVNKLDPESYCFCIARNKSDETVFGDSSCENIIEAKLEAFDKLSVLLG